MANDVACFRHKNTVAQLNGLLIHILFTCDLSADNVVLMASCLSVSIYLCSCFCRLFKTGY